jgi:hypothetical protein
LIEVLRNIAIFILRHKNQSENSEMASSSDEGWKKYLSMLEYIRDGMRYFDKDELRQSFNASVQCEPGLVDLSVATKLCLETKLVSKGEDIEHYLKINALEGGRISYYQLSSMLGGFVSNMKDIEEFERKLQLLKLERGRVSGKTANRMLQKLADPRMSWKVLNLILRYSDFNWKVIPTQEYFEALFFLPWNKK